ncbi:MAG: hypothetical protein J5I50_03060 [Chitinophagaceae bacterium]|nr:hypothetical protein [Chitinophagaceae bacterium]
MKILLLILGFFSFPALVFSADTTNIPLARQVFHDRIVKEQIRADRADGHQDGVIRVGSNSDINLLVTDAIFRRINVLRNDIEENKDLKTNNDKVRYLRYLEFLIRDFINAWRGHSLPPSMAPSLLDCFTDVFYAQMNGESMLPYIEKAPYEVGKIVVNLFRDNEGYQESRLTLFKKFATLYPGEILSNIGPYAEEDFADSLVIVAFNNSPSQLYSYSQSRATKQGQLISRSKDSRIQTVVQLARQPRALFYFPFLDDLINGRKTIEEISKVAGTDDSSYDSIGYFRLLVKTEIEYYGRLIRKDTPIAMFGANGLVDMLQRKAIQHFVTPINDLHEMPNNIRFQALNPLNAQELYYMMVLGENDIYTSSYKYSFDRMMQVMGPNPHGDSLLISLNFDKFKKFIKLAAGYNRLDVFLKTMAPQNSEKLMQAFVLNLEKTGSLEDAVDVADSYGSITDPALLKSMLTNVEWNLDRCKKQNDERGMKIYGLLKTILLSSDPANNIDLSKEIGIPPIYTVDNSYLTDDSGRIIEQVFFYGDKDGIMSYNSYLTSFPASDWTITDKKLWIEIKSKKGKPVWIYANKPLDNNEGKDAEAQDQLRAYMDEQGLVPSIIIHRGHSYHLQATINQLSESNKIIMLGSCGGYQNLKTILDYAPEAHIISTKQTGAMNVNKPIIDLLDNTLREGKDIDWRKMWAGLNNQFMKAPKQIRETFEDYIPPQKNLGALFIKAYQKDGSEGE